MPDSSRPKGEKIMWGGRTYGRTQLLKANTRKFCNPEKGGGPRLPMRREEGTPPIQTQGKLKG